MNVEKLIATHKKNEKQITRNKKQIEKLPKHQLYCTRNKNYIKWFQTDGKLATYICKKDRTLAEKLAIKKYLSFQIEDLQSENKAIDAYLNKHKNSSKADALLAPDSLYCELLAPYFAASSDAAKKWIQEPYEQSERNPEHLIHKTPAGHMVRSKSELNIASALYRAKIPYRYECGVEMEGKMFYPDFTICHPKTGQIFYWEHFGMMDDSNYVKSTFEKLKFYCAYDIIPTINLITTYETLEHPLDITYVDELIQQYFM